MKPKNFSRLLFILLLFISSLAVSAQDDTKFIKNSLPKMLGNSSMGLEYYLTIPPVFDDESAGSENFIKIFVSSSVRTLVTVEVEGSGYHSARNTIPNDIIEFNITPVQGQPFTKMGRDPNVPERIFPGKGIHIFANQPILVYVVCRYKFTSDGFLALPVHLLGKEYIVAGHEVDPMFRAQWNYKFPNMTGIVASNDNTRIRFTLGGNTETRTAGGMTPGQTKEWTLQKGDVVMISTDADEADLSGSKIIADKPIAVVTGNMCANVPVGNRWCDYIVEMNIPTEIWDKTYLVPKIPNRKNSSIIKIFAKEAQTKLYKDGDLISELTTSGGQEGKGYMSMRMVPLGNEPRSVVISGDKPINVVLYNPGVEEDGTPTPSSDPFQMGIMPLESFGNELTINTPGILGGVGFPENYVALIYAADEDGKMPKDFEFASVQSGNFKWEQLNYKFPGNDEVFNYQIDDKKYSLKIITLPKDGVYKIRSKENEFGAYLFGYSSYDSYGYPAGFAEPVRPLPKDTMPPVPTYTVNSDGSVTDGIVTDMPDNDTIRANLAMILMDDLNSFNYIFKYIDFIPGETRTTTWELEVIDPRQSAKATIVFTDRAGNDTIIVIEYEFNENYLYIYPRLIDYGDVEVPSNKITENVLIKNLSQGTTFVINDMIVSTEQFDIDLTSIQLPYSLTPNDSITVPVSVSLKDLGHFTDTVKIIIQGNTDDYVFLEADGVNNVESEILVTDIDFGTVYDIDSHVQQCEVKNIGQEDLSLYGITGLNNPQFTADFPPYDVNTGNFNNPIIISSGATHVFNITFKADSWRSYNEFIIFKSSAVKTDSLCLITAKAVDPATDVTATQDEEAAIFPVPAKDKLNIRLTETEEVVKLIDIVNTVGEVVYSNDKISGSSLTLDLEGLPSGNYFVRIFFESDKKIIRKFSISR